jgi:hypothetical protein
MLCQRDNMLNFLGAGGQHGKQAGMEKLGLRPRRRS